MRTRTRARATQLRPTPYAVACTVAAARIQIVISIVARVKMLVSLRSASQDHSQAVNKKAEPIHWAKTESQKIRVLNDPVVKQRVTRTSVRKISKRTTLHGHCFARSAARAQSREISILTHLHRLRGFVNEHRVEALFELREHGVAGAGERRAHDLRFVEHLRNARSAWARACVRALGAEYAAQSASTQLGSCLRDFCLM
eukprot:4475949-Pleurochrysis_carterae.AAC.2